jgi:predicted nucleotidyltransferase
MISLRSKVTIKLLNYFFIHDKARFYIRELARDLKEYPSNIRMRLLALLKEGILLDDFKGAERFFFLNKNYRFLKEYKQIVQKGFGIEAILKESLSKIKGVKHAWVFGSYAKNKLTPTSDIDILIVGQYDFNKLHSCLYDLQHSLKIEVNPVEYSVEEYNRKLKEKDNFLTSVFRNKLIEII